MAATATKNGKTTTEAEAEVEQQPLIEITEVSRERLLVPIVGVTPLIQHNWSAKAKEDMLRGAEGERKQKTKKDPQEEYLSAFYPLLSDGGFGHPADAFKDATVQSARFFGKSVTMKALQQFIFIKGEVGPDGRQMVRIEGEPTRRQDTVRIGRGGADNRFRPQFWPWSATLEVVYFTGALTRGSVLQLIGASGESIGVGEWRPERGGTFGTYRVAGEVLVVA